ncbi:MAG: GNAT family N-acetyltransferase [Thermoguttaceae bacterium]|nr:GNAT family N-acetyltransferase [Thermoguttaceae bacterium]
MNPTFPDLVRTRRSIRSFSGEPIPENTLNAILDLAAYAPSSWVGHPVGCVGFLLGEKSNLVLPDGEAELGYWLGAPFRSRGLIPEAVNALVRRAFDDLRLPKIRCGTPVSAGASVNDNHFSRVRRGVFGHCSAFAHKTVFPFRPGRRFKPIRFGVKIQCTE